MKRWSLKAKLTALYTFFMTLLTCAALAVLFSLSSQEVLSSTQEQIKHLVQESVEEVDVDADGLDVDNDFLNLEKDVYLSLYDEQGNFLYGRMPYGFHLSPDFQDGQLQQLKDKGTLWYVYDLQQKLEGYGTLYFRGITSVTEAERNMKITQRFALILLPLMVVLTAFIGYRFTKRTLRSVQKITETVQNIQKDGDLSRRVGLGQGKGKDEIYQLSLTFDEMLEQLQEAFAREKQFTSDVSHELRTPVTVILTQCDSMLQDQELTEAQKKEITLIQKKARTMGQMISQLLMLSRADQGRQNLQKEWLDISELTEMAAEEQQLLAREKGIEIVTEIQPGIRAMVDESFYIRLLVNLISNAVSYNRKFGHVWVRLSATEQEITGMVEDDGIGIPRESLSHIWERFYRVDASRSDSSHSGLGLAMVQWIVRAHGGTIQAESQVGKGSRFLFTLPREKEEKL